MISIFDNFFDDPEFIVNLANNEQYYDNQNPSTEWLGKRSFELLCMHPETYSPIINKMVDTCFSSDRINCNYNWSCDLFFHRLFKEQTANQEWIHKDPAVFAGVVYLNKNAPKDSGTRIILEDKEILIDNVFNRLVLYSGSLSHSACYGFGSCNEDSRLTLNVFFKKFSIDMSII
jgi:hypothetical protein